MSVAQRYTKVLVHSTFGIPKLATYDRHFPGWPIGFSPEDTVSNMALDGILSTGKQVKTFAVVTSKFPSVHFLAVGARDVFKKRGLTENLYLEFEFGARDFGPIAARVREANPDILYMGAIGLEGNQLLEALEKINYTPKNHMYVYPSPGQLAQSPLGKDALSLTIYEDLPPFSDNPEAATFARLYREAATKAGFPFVDPETQAGAGYSSWQILTGAVNATKSLNDDVLTAHLKKNGADTIVGNDDATNTINAGAGNDTIYLGKANSTIEGGDGTDTVCLAKLKTKWQVTFNAETGTYTCKNGAITNTVHGVESIKGWNGTALKIAVLA
jgi:branched-chain amino acid transport system substrate-binding protein